MKQPICGPLVEGVLLDVLANNPRALFVAATKEAAAIVAVPLRPALACMIVLLRHRNSLSFERTPIITPIM
jgi:hypothetical protein